MIDYYFSNAYIVYKIFLTILFAFAFAFAKSSLVEVNKTLLLVNNVTRKVEWIGLIFIEKEVMNKLIVIV